MLLPIAAALLAQTLTVSVSAAPRIETFRFHFENPSTFDSSELVPHFFEQRYRAPAPWFALTAHYKNNDITFETVASTSLHARTRGSDIDTFELPGGDVATSGTDGEVMMRSWQVSQRAVIDLNAGWTAGVIAEFRSDHADFLPDNIVVTHTQPPSRATRFTTDREMTTTRIFSAGAVAERVQQHGAWRVRYGGSVQPLIAAHLVVQLPDKYPGVDLPFSAFSAGASAHASVERRLQRWFVGASISASAAWSYRRTSSYSMRGVTFAVTSGVGIR